MYFIYLSPIRKECGSSFDQNSLHPCALVYFGWNWPSGSERRFSKVINYLPLESSEGLHPSLKDALCQLWMKLAPWFWRRIFWNTFIWINLIPFTKGCFMPSFVIALISPMEMAMVLHLDRLESPLPKDALCQVWLKLAQWFWRRWWK